MAENKFSCNIQVSPVSAPDESIVEESDIKEAEDILASPHDPNQDAMDQNNANEMDKLVNSQSMSIIFQDMNESQLAKFNKMNASKLKEIPEDQWNDIKIEGISNKIRNLDSSNIIKSKEKTHNSFNGKVDKNDAQNEEKDASKRSGIKTSTTPLIIRKDIPKLDQQSLNKRPSHSK
jgi:hypothetical protein